MKTIIELLENSGVFHWIVSLLGIFSVMLVKLIHVKDFSMQRWTRENIIRFIWSIFILSLVVTISHDYFPGFTHIEAYLTGYSGAHMIFRFVKEPIPDSDQDEGGSDGGKTGSDESPKKDYDLKPPHSN